MITATIYPRRTLLGRKSWGIRFQTENNEKLGHQYNTPQSAERGAERFFRDPGEEVILRVVDEHGKLLSRRRIRPTTPTA